MGLGLLYGSPNHYLTQNWYASGVTLARWIEREIPSFVGNVPVKYTEALMSVLRRHRVPEAMIRDAFLILEKNGIRFDGVRVISPISHITPLPPPNRHGAPDAPQARGISAGEWFRTERYSFEEYERKYVLATKTNDPAGAEAIIAAVLQLLWEIARGYGKTRQAASARNEKMAEWEEFNLAVNNALARAQTLRTHMRYLSRDDIATLRNAPTPDAARIVAVRIAPRITMRTMPRARRARR